MSRNIFNTSGKVIYTSKNTHFLRTALAEALLKGVDLANADLAGINDFSGMDFSKAKLENAVFSGADIRNCKFDGAHISGIDFTGVISDKHTRNQLAFKKTQIVADGNIFVYKKAFYGLGPKSAIITLLIPTSAKRSNSPNMRKCRAEYTKVLSIEDYKGKKLKSAYSTHDYTFEYRVGKIVRPVEKFDEDSFKECASGIHFFITKEEAKDY